MQEVNHLSIRWRSRIIFQRTRKKICHHDRLHSATMRHPIKIMGGWGHTCLKNTPRPRIFRFVTLHLENSRQNETLPLDGNSTIVFSWLPLEILLICLLTRGIKIHIPHSIFLILYSWKFHVPDPPSLDLFWNSPFLVLFH